MDPKKTVGQILKENNTSITDFVRFQVCDGLEKVNKDFASEVKEVSKSF